MTLEEFGCVGPNDWPLVVPSKWKLYGPAADHYRDKYHKAPVFRSENAAINVLKKLYRSHCRMNTAMRLFKVYNCDESDHEIVFARNRREAASIAKTVWGETGYRCRHFKVVELCLPASIQEGGEPVGLVYEPASTPKVVIA